MSEIAEAPVKQESTNWDAITNAFDGTKLVETKTETPTETNPTENNPPAAEVVPPAETPKENTEVKPEDKPVVEEKPEEAVFEFKLEGIEPVMPANPEDGTWFAVAKAEGIEVKEDSWDAVKEAIIAPYVKQAEENKVIGMEKLLSSVSPETATYLKLIEMGIPEAEILAPTREIDSYLSLDKTALVRADLEAKFKSIGLDSEAVDLKMEQIVAAGNIDKEAEIITAQLTAAKNKILEDRQNIVKQYEERSQQASLIKKQEDIAQFQKELDTVLTFLGGKLSPETKEMLKQKYANGVYEAELSSPQSKVNYVLLKELGEQIVKNIKSTASSNANEKVMKTLTNIPPTLNNTAGNTQQPIKENNNWSAIERAFGG